MGFFSSIGDVVGDVAGWASDFIGNNVDVGDIITAGRTEFWRRYETAV